MRTIGTLKYIMATLFICLMSSMPAHAQWKSDADTVKLSRWEPHMSVSTGFLGTSYGDNRLYTSVAPSLTFRPNDRWKMNAGFRITSDMGLNLTGTYAPLYGFGNGDVFDVSATAVSAAASYRFGDNNFLHLAFTYIRDEQGTLPYMWHDAWMSGYGAWGMHALPMGCYHGGDVYGRMFAGGCY